MSRCCFFFLIGCLTFYLFIYLFFQGGPSQNPPKLNGRFFLFFSPPLFPFLTLPYLSKAEQGEQEKFAKEYVDILKKYVGGGKQMALLVCIYIKL